MLDNVKESFTIQTPTTKRQPMKHTLYDIAAAVVIGLLLTVGALAYFDVLTK
jgi:hypothetical protein